MANGWDSTCGGGIWWSKDRNYKNAIANELSLSVAAHLAARTSDPVNRAQYLAWAHKEWDWFANSGMINSQHLINGRLDLAICKNNQKTTWTYNQDVILGGLTELNRVAPDPALSAMAQSIATAAISPLTDSRGILHDTCEPKCGEDGVQFKGIFVRNLMALTAHSLIRITATSFRSMLKASGIAHKARIINLARSGQAHSMRGMPAASRQRLMLLWPLRKSSTVNERAV